MNQANIATQKQAPLLVAAAMLLMSAQVAAEQDRLPVMSSPPLSSASSTVSSAATVQPAHGASLEQILKKATDLRQGGQARQAIDLLKGASQQFPSNERLHQALALAYLAADNEFWALRTLEQFEQDHPPACDSRAFQAWIHINQANLDLAEQILDTPGCDTPDYVGARQSLLRALHAAQYEDAARVKTHLQQARSSSKLYAEDKALLQTLSSRFDPYRVPWVTGRVGIGAGWTSNGLAGSPIDPIDQGRSVHSPLLVIDARARLVVPAWRFVKPVLEVKFRDTEMFSANVRGLSYRVPSVHPGILIGEALPRLQVSYGFDAVQVAARDWYEDGPLWFSEGHRVDYELEVTDLLYVFGGGGHRKYREAGRSRWEAEQGLAVGIPIAIGWKLTTGLSAHWYRAFNRSYDTTGATALAQLQVRLPASFEARVNASVNYDVFPRSKGYFTGSGDKHRADVQLRFKPGVWSPVWHGLRGGLEYEYGNRFSTAKNYAFDDHRVLLHGVWTFDSDSLATRSISAENREVLPYRTQSAEQFDQDVRIRDLMQQDEAVKRGSSCMK